MAEEGMGRWRRLNGHHRRMALALAFRRPLMAASGGTGEPAISSWRAEDWVEA